MAMLYNDQSVNENHHLSTGFAILQKEQHDILSHMSRSDRKGTLQPKETLLVTYIEARQLLANCLIAILVTS